MIAFKYVSPEGNDADYPWNPNGSPGNIAGICNMEGNVFGMMPHPERSFYMYQHPQWTAMKINSRADPYDLCDGAMLFQSALDYICATF